MEDDSEEHMGETVCICGKVYEEGMFMIQCDICRDWLHGECVQIDELAAADIDKYHCPKCEPLCGPSILRQETNWHRHDRSDPHASYKPLQAGTRLFVEELGQRFFSPADDIIMKVSGKQLTLPYLNQSGFTHPIVVTDKEGLGITAPPPNFNVTTVVDALGPDHVLDIIDVMRQKTCQMTAEQFGNHFYNPKSERVLNCLSLEVTSTPLSEAITPPLVARKLCWVNNVWPSSNTLTHRKPQVQKYCIMSMKDSYTDFHIDFGGTSVWYHIFSGEKHFFLIRPTPGNLSLYERWTRLATQSETFLGDMVDKCYKLRLKAGQTVFIPTGWIHAVYTPVNSVVFGGNFLHSLNIQLQLRIYELEGRLKDPPKYRFPSFEVVHWLAAGKLKKDLADLNSDNTACPENLLNGIRALVCTLRIWINEADKHEPIVQLDCSSILKDLNREVKTAEKISLKVNPPKPERESNRRRKKKIVDDDFIDTSDPSSLYMYDWEQKHKPTGARKSVKPKSDKVVAVKSRPPGPSDIEMSEIEDGGFNFNQSKSRQTVSPLRLSLHVDDSIPSQDSRDTEQSAEGDKFVSGDIISNADSINTENDQKYDLTDRDSVRQLMVTKKQAVTDLKNELDDAMVDFGADDELVIDDKPKNRSAKKPLKLRLSVGSSSSASDSNNLALEGNSEPYLHESVGSPSTRDAIEGMLSFSQLEKLPPKLAVKASLKDKERRKAQSMIFKNERRNSDSEFNVHQDEDFVYPTLDQSDDEDIPYTPQKDEAWNPKIKMSNLGPKMDRPIRESAKNVAIEKGLKQASERKGGYVKINSPGKIKKSKPMHNFNIKSTTKNVDADFVIDKSRTKKVGNTAKQRLGKILGLKF